MINIDENSRLKEYELLRRKLSPFDIDVYSMQYAHDQTLSLLNNWNVKHVFDDNLDDRKTTHANNFVNESVKKGFVTGIDMNDESPSKVTLDSIYTFKSYLNQTQTKERMVSTPPNKVGLQRHPKSCVYYLSSGDNSTYAFVYYPSAFDFKKNSVDTKIGNMPMYGDLELPIWSSIGDMNFDVNTGLVWGRKLYIGGYPLFELEEYGEEPISLVVSLAGLGNKRVSIKENMKLTSYGVISKLNAITNSFNIERSDLLRRTYVPSSQNSRYDATGYITGGYYPTTYVIYGNEFKKSYINQIIFPSWSTQDMTQYYNRYNIRSSSERKNYESDTSDIPYF